MTNTDKYQENRLRIAARRQGLRLIKSRRRDPRAVDYGAFMIVDPPSNFVVAGGSPSPYMLGLDDVQQWLASAPAGSSEYARRIADARSVARRLGLTLIHVKGRLGNWNLLDKDRAPMFSARFGADLSMIEVELSALREQGR